MKKDFLVIVRGGGDLATGCIHRLWSAGFKVLVLECAAPAAIHFWASLEHKLRYKKNINAEILQKLEKELITCSNQISIVDMKMQEIKNRIAEIKDR